MLAKRIIPCLDVRDSRVVKGVKFLSLKDAGDPVESAIYYDAEGADELVFLDITASHENRKTMVNVVERTAESIFIPFTVGGGIRNMDDIRDLLNAGCDKVSINTSCVKDPGLIERSSGRFGSQCIVVAIDAKSKPEAGGWEVYINGGRTPTGIDALGWAEKVCSLGAGEILLTSMDCDGTTTGYDIGLTSAISGAVRVPVIASGGAGEPEHFHDVLTRGRADAVLAASVFHYRKYTVRQIKEFLKEKGLCVRL